MSCIRVLQIVTHMNRGGLESMLMNYYRNIDRSKIQFDFLEDRPGKHDFTDEIISLGGKIYTVPAVNPINTNGYLTAIDKFFKENKDKYKIVHSHLDCLSAYPLKYAKKYEIPVRIAHGHSTSEEKNWKYPIKMYLRSQIPKYATHLFACSEEAGKWMFGMNEFKIINNAIDARKFTYDVSKRIAKRKELNIENKFVVGHIGRFSTPKNHKFLIDIFKVVHERNNNAILLLVGDGELRKSIESKVRDLGLESSVIFTGVRADISEMLQAIDVFVLPSFYEGLGIAAVEAQATGLHCIVADTIPKEAYVTNLIESLPLVSSPDVWAKEVLKYSDGYDRINTYEQIKTRGYDIEENSKRLEKFYLSMWEA